MYKNIIIIPYRCREKHLEYYLENTVPLLKKFLPNSKLVVVEQVDGKLFNRGKLLNVAFKEYQHKTDYFIMHDVDINPKEKTIKELYYPDIKDEDSILGIYTSKRDTLGGIVKISHKHIFLINGFPNDIWGWGTEDRVLQLRSKLFNLKKITNFLNDNQTRDDQHFKCFNDISDRIKINQKKNTQKHVHLLKSKEFHALPDDEKKSIIYLNGLNNIEYKIINKKEINNFVEIIKVDI